MILFFAGFTVGCAFGGVSVLLFMLWLDMRDHNKFWRK